MERYSRHIILSEIGQEGQDKISNAKVLVVGAGGLGCPVLQYLAAAGVGSIRIIDFDDVHISNLQRQILFGTSSLGINKALAAKKRLEDLNPNINIEAFNERLTIKNAIKFFYNFDVIVDGTDNFETRYLINDVAILCDKPVVYGAIYKFEGQVSVFNYKNGPSYRCLFPFPPNNTNSINCSEIGVLGVLPGIIGTMMANEVLKIILGLDHILSGKLLCYNSKTAETTTLKFNKNQNEFDNLLKVKDDAINTHVTDISKDQNREVSSKYILLMDNVQFIDVREPDESPKVNLENCIQIPLANLEQNIHKIDLTKTLIVFCQSGKRSLKAVEILRKRNIIDCMSLKGGAFNLIEELQRKL